MGAMDSPSSSRRPRRLRVWANDASGSLQRIQNFRNRDNPEARRCSLGQYPGFAVDAFAPLLIAFPQGKACSGWCDG
jgi:hypothetical protein